MWFFAKFQVLLLLISKHLFPEPSVPLFIRNYFADLVKERYRFYSATQTAVTQEEFLNQLEQLLDFIPITEKKWFIIKMVQNFKRCTCCAGLFKKIQCSRKLKNLVGQVVH